MVKNPISDISINDKFPKFQFSDIDPCLNQSIPSPYFNPGHNTCINNMRQNTQARDPKGKLKERQF